MVSLQTFGRVVSSGPMGELHARRRDQDVERPAEDHPQPLHRRVQLLQVAHVCPDTEGIPAGLLDLQLCQVEFRLAAPATPRGAPPAQIPTPGAFQSRGSLR